MPVRSLRTDGSGRIASELAKDVSDLLNYKNAVENELARIERALGEKIRLAKINR